MVEAGAAALEVALDNPRKLKKSAAKKRKR
jgi:hypothetical protein